VNTDYGTLDETIDLPEVAADLVLTICVNPTFIVDALNSTTDDNRTMSFYPDKNLIRITGGTCRCLMPTIVEKPKVEEKAEEK
jgi:hypothetical protein